MDNITDTLKALPHQPGIYIYKDNQGSVLYVGKAVDLSRRVKSYFSRDDAVGAKTSALVSLIYSIDTIQTASEFDALLLEAKLIKHYLPKYNVIAKDDKSPLYVHITLSEQLPRIEFVRKREIEQSQEWSKKDKLYGPFQSSRVVRMLLRNLRHAIPYCIQKRRTGSGCFYTHLGLCKPCPSIIAKMTDVAERQHLTRVYRKNIIRISRILSGQSRTVMGELEKEMNKLAIDNKFEAAGELKNQIDSLYQLLSHRYDPSIYLERNTLASDMRDAELVALQQLLTPVYPTVSYLSRIECIDISHLSGVGATGSVVVLTNGLVDSSQYRRFRIRGIAAADDTSRMREVLERRLRHDEWPLPDLLIVDGGKAQVNTTLEVLKQNHPTLPVIGLAKRQEEIIVKVDSAFKIIRLPLTSPALQLVQRIRDEAHRFAKTYQIKLRGKVFRLR